MLFFMFEKEKKERLLQLYLPDKSPKGNVDKAVFNLLDTINSKANYYTMSSCSGRSSISNVKDEGKGLEWLYVTHDEIQSTDTTKIISNLPEGLIYFRYEGLILHVCARSLEDAEKLMILGQNNGCKYSAIISTKKRYVVEFIDMKRIDLPIANNKELLVSKEYIEMLIDEANKKLKQTHSLIERLRIAIKEM